MIDVSWSRSLRVARTPPSVIDTVVVVGPSGAGKTTLVDAVRSANLPNVDVPIRYMTRAPRQGDSELETLHVGPEQFQQYVRDQEIVVHWNRTFEAGRTTRYGFRRSRSGAIAVLSANTAILSPAAQLQPPRALEHALILGVAAPTDVRRERIARRSPNLRPEELAFRLEHDHATDVDVTIENHGELEAVTKAEVVELLARLSSSR